MNFEYSQFSFFNLQECQINFSCFYLIVDLAQVAMTSNLRFIVSLFSNTPSIFRYSRHYPHQGVEKRVALPTNQSSAVIPDSRPRFGCRIWKCAWKSCGGFHVLWIPLTAEQACCLYPTLHNNQILVPAVWFPFRQPLSGLLNRF